VLGIAALTTAAAVTLAGAARAETGVDPKKLQSKIYYCETCHGVKARGFRGYYPIPRLAGQTEQYLLNQLGAFDERRRLNNVMFNVAHVQDPAMIRALVDYFHNQNPPPLGGAPKELAAEGKKLFLEGVPDKDVPPCATCHGEDGHGNDDYPRLAGQLHDYIFAKLKNWNSERGQDPKKPDNSAIMQPIAHNLTDQQIRAIAAYVNYLE
jgi:cytochrome c553